MASDAGTGRVLRPRYHAGAMRLPHEGGIETIWTLLGVAILALGHDLNRRATY